MQLHLCCPHGDSRHSDYSTLECSYLLFPDLAVFQYPKQQTGGFFTLACKAIYILALSGLLTLEIGILALLLVKCSFLFVTSSPANSRLRADSFLALKILNTFSFQFNLKSHPLVFSVRQHNVCLWHSNLCVCVVHTQLRINTPLS